MVFDVSPGANVSVPLVAVKSLMEAVLVPASAVVKVTVWVALAVLARLTMKINWPPSATLALEME